MDAEPGQAAGSNQEPGQAQSAGGSAAAAHAAPGFFRRYIFATDHKMVARQFLFTGLAMFLVGGALALTLRWQLAYPGNLPGGRCFAAIGLATKTYGFQPQYHAPLVELKRAQNAQRELTADQQALIRTQAELNAVCAKLSRQEAAAARLAAGQAVDEQDRAAAAATLTAAEQAVFDTYGEARYTMAGEQYNMLFTMHASVMVFLVLIPLLSGAFGHFLIPLQIGARNMAFPFLNLVSYWLLVPAAGLMLAGFFVPGGAASAGWTAYPPLSNFQSPELYNPGSAAGQTLWLWAVLLVGCSGFVGAVNSVATVLKKRAPGMTLWRLPLTVWSLFITGIIVLIGTPVLACAAVLLLVDRSGWLQAGIFKPEQGGQPLLWQQLFWFYAQPALYSLILPAMGMVSDMLATFARKPIFGYRTVVYALAAIAVLGTGAWGQHLYQSGMSPALAMAFMVPATLIALPSAVIVFHWLGTLWKSNMQLTVPMLNALAFVGLLVIGGLAGIFLAAAPVNRVLHGTYFVVGHIHYVLFGGSLFAVFGAVQFWFPKMFGRMMSRTLGYIHFVITFVAFNITFFPMFILGLAGHPRRIPGSRWDELTGTGYQYLEPVQGLNTMMTHGAVLLAAGQLFFLANLLYSLWRGPKASQNPWDSNTLEWAAAPTPTIAGNFGPELPVVYNGPYEYGHPAVSADYLPQNRKVERMPSATPEASAAAGAAVPAAGERNPGP